MPRSPKPKLLPHPPPPPPRIRITNRTQESASGPTTGQFLPVSSQHQCHEYEQHPPRRRPFATHSTSSSITSLIHPFSVPPSIHATSCPTTSLQWTSFLRHPVPWSAAPYHAASPEAPTSATDPTLSTYPEGLIISSTGTACSTRSFSPRQGATECPPPSSAPATFALTGTSSSAMRAPLSSPAYSPPSTEPLVWRAALFLPSGY